MRAAFIIVRNYIQRHKLNTIRKIITRWAPASENNTAKYIETVCQRSHIGPDEVIRWDNTCQMMALVLAMSYVENGQEISLEDAVDGWILVNK